MAVDPRFPRHRWLPKAASAGVGLLLVTACGSKSAPSASPAPTGAPPTAVSTTVPPAATTVPTIATTTAPPSTASTVPPTTTVVGLTLSGAGNTFTAPSAPTTTAFNSDCRTLVDPGFYGRCVLVTAPSGTIAAIVEQQQQNYQPGQPITAGQERDLVYREINNAWSLVERRTPVAAGEATTEVYESVVMRDGDPKAVFVEPAANSQYGNELDLVDGTGAVTLFRQLHGGFATVPAGGGLDTYVPNPTSGYDQATIDYAGGAWKITSTSHVSDSQAQSLTSQAFYDPQEVQATS